MTEDQRGFNFAAAVHEAVMTFGPSGMSHAEKTILAGHMTELAVEWVKAGNRARAVAPASARGKPA